ncbi:thiamine pyrophosphate-dependent enzyme [Candidatus Harpocratesius sp.]
MKYHISHPKELFMPNLNGSRILTGNEAFVRGLFESNVQFLATYPGTPASEIGDLWEWYADENPEIFYDLAVNETIAFEAAVGAAWSGVRAAVSFKHLGMNLISDALHAVMYSGIDGKRKAGLVILCGGDPDINSSTNAVDTRLFSYHSQLPILEPSSIQECKDIVKDAFNLSEMIDLPVMIYFPSQIAHASGVVNIFEVRIELISKLKRKFQKNSGKLLNAIHWAKNNQSMLYSKIFKLAHGYYELKPHDLRWEIKGKNTGILTKNRININQPLQVSKSIDILNKVEDQVSFEREPILVGFIGSGLGWSLIEELSLRISVDFPRLRLKLTYPFPIEAILNFIEQFEPELLVIVEDLEPFLEKEIQEILYQIPVFIPIIGKKSFPRVGVLTPDIIHNILANPLVIQDETFFFQEFKDHLIEPSSSLNHIASQIPVREPTFCPGCSHRNVFYSLRKAVNLYYKKTGKEPIFGGDIGCYTMSMSKPYETMDWLICMGAGVGIANGVSHIVDPDKQHVIAMVGDSTFFHSGIHGIINLIKNNVDVLVIILDNYYCAMTGHQQSPSTPLQYKHNSKISAEIVFSIEEIVRSLGNVFIQKMDGYSIKLMQNQFFKLFSKPGVKIALVQAECALQMTRRKNKINSLFSKQKLTYLSISEDCTKCDECFRVLGCTAIQEQNERYYIDINRCLVDECASCIEICPNSAIQITQIIKEMNNDE